MPNLPLLKTGAPAQYPFRRSLKQGVATISFVDGSEQRCAIAKALHEWTMQLGLIDEDELKSFETFFEQMQAETGQFTFVDPANGTQYSNCSFAMSVLQEIFDAPGKVRATLIIRENPS